MIHTMYSRARALHARGTGIDTLLLQNYLVFEAHDKINTAKDKPHKNTVLHSGLVLNNLGHVRTFSSNLADSYSDQRPHRGNADSSSRKLNLAYLPGGHECAMKH